MKEIPWKEFSARAADLWLNRWFLLTAGNKEEYNTMAVAWGSIGGIWNRPFVQVVVRPTRYTYGFINNHDTFTLCSFPEEYHGGIFWAQHGSWNRTTPVGARVMFTALDPETGDAVGARRA